MVEASRLLSPAAAGHQSDEHRSTRLTWRMRSSTFWLVDHQKAGGGYDRGGVAGV
jgi:hypothetical protein